VERTPGAAQRQGGRLPYVGSLDGLRAACLLAVLAYHGGFTWAGGGFLGVSTFFTLSGFLITALILVEVRGSGRVDLRRFWSARARRLVPAALVTLVLVLAFARFGATSTHLVGLRSDLWATAGLAINWRLAAVGATYGNAADATPVQHLWSLAVEEQFYLVLPLACLGAIALGRRLGQPLRVVLGVGAAALAVASTVALALSVGDDVSFAYYATHTRAAELLAGVVLACVVHHLVGWRHRRRVVPVVGLVGAAGLVGAWALADQASRLLYTGGLALYSLASVAVIVACLYPGPVRAVLEVRPLRWLGRASYGAYLYHWPIFSWLREENTELGPVPLFALRVALTLALAGASLAWVEMPIRRRRVLPRVPRPAMAAVAVAVLALSFVVPLRTVDTGPSGVEVVSGQRVAPPDGAPTPVSSVATTEPDTPRVERLLLVGDSVPQQLAPYVAEALPGVDVRYIGDGGTGPLTDQGAVVGQVQAAVADIDPDVVLFHYAGTYLRLEPDEEPYVLPDGTEVGDGSEEMFAQWDVVSRELVRVAGSRGATVLWGLIPQIGPGTTFGFMADRVERFNALYRSLGVATLDWFTLTTGPGGGYAEELPSADGRVTERARDGDGLHFTAFGYRLLAATVAEEVARWRGRRSAEGPVTEVEPTVPGGGAPGITEPPPPAPG